MMPLIMSHSARPAEGHAAGAGQRPRRVEAPAGHGGQGCGLTEHGALGAGRPAGHRDVDLGPPGNGGAGRRCPASTTLPASVGAVGRRW